MKKQLLLALVALTTTQIFSTPSKATETSSAETISAQQAYADSLKKLGDNFENLSKESDILSNRAEFLLNTAAGVGIGASSEFLIVHAGLNEITNKFRNIGRSFAGQPEKKLDLLTRTLTRIPYGTATTIGLFAPLLIARAKMGITTTDKQWRSLQLNDQF